MASLQDQGMEIDCRLEKTEVDEKPYLFGGRETHLKRQRETVVESSVGAEVGVPE